MMFEPQSVADALEDVYAQAVAPHFRQLADGAVREKRPGNLVTIADEAAERLLIARLEVLWKGSVATGEEAIERGEFDALQLQGEGRFWCIDPIDGTRAFVEGNPRFTMLVSAIEDARIVGAFAYAPVLGRLAMVSVDGRLVLRGNRATRERARVIGEARISTHRSGFNYRSGEVISRLKQDVERIVPSVGFGIDFLDFLFGDLDAVLFTSISPWEYPCGVLLAEALGASLARANGEALQSFPAERSLFIAAHSSELLNDIVSRITLSETP